ncbi:MAG: EamA family transporter [Gemmatimonadetes bacterium]|nr:EamA family transporter [Gemmatimonadota bacterium]
MSVRTETAGQVLSAPGRGDEVRWHTDVLLLLMALMWGLNFSVLKFTSAFMGGLAINAIRIPIAAFAQLGIAAGRAMTRPDPREARVLVFLGMLGNGVYQVFFILGLMRSSVATAALLIAASPAFVAIVGRLEKTEFLNGRQWLGVGLQIVGCAAVALGAVRNRAAGSDSILGVVFLWSAALSWAFYATRVKHYSHHVEPWYLGGYTMLGGAIVAVAVGIPALMLVDWGALPAMAWGALAYSSLIAMVVAYLFYYRGLRVLGPTRTSMYSNLQPIVAIAVAWGFLHEKPTVAQLTGATLIVGGLLLARSDAEPAEA